MDTDKNQEVGVLERFSVGLAFSFVYGFLSPFVFYVGNSTQFSSTAGELLVLLFVWFLFLFIIYNILQWIFDRSSTLGWHYAIFVLSMAMLGWFQSQVLVWDFGPLDGRGIDWSRWSRHSFIELSIWISVPFLAAFFIRRRNSILRYTSFFVIFLVFLSLVTQSFNLYAERRHNVNHPNNEGIFDFHEKNNVLLFVLDTVQSDVFDEIRKNYPDEVAFLEGFDFYPNTLGGYPTTQASIPLILTGRFYQNEEPVRAWMARNNALGNLADSFLDLDYGAAIAFLNQIDRSVFQGVRSKVVSMRDVSLSRSAVRNSDFALMVDGGSFRALPTALKPALYKEGNWFFSRFFVDSKAPPGIHGDDWRFEKAFRSDSSVKSSKLGEFRLFHLAAGHWPLQLNEQYEYTPGVPETRDSYINQVRGAFFIMRRIIERIKELGIYDDADILIVSDHGSHSITMRPVDIVDNAIRSVDDIHMEVLAASRPLFLYKPRGSRGVLNVHERAVHLKDIPCFYFHDEDFDCKVSADINLSRERVYFHYDWSKEYWGWDRDFMPPMTMYLVKGDVRDIASWENTYLQFAEGGRRYLPKATSYVLGEKIRFSRDGGSDQYVKRGWGHAELTHRWSDGSRAVVFLGVKGESAFNGYKLVLNGFSYQNIEQEVAVEVNGEEVGTVKIGSVGRYEVVFVPTDDNYEMIEIAFKPSRVVTPCEVSESHDCRMLGIAIQELSLNRLD